MSKSFGDFSLGDYVGNKAGFGNSRPQTSDYIWAIDRKEAQKFDSMNKKEKNEAFKEETKRLK